MSVLVATIDGYHVFTSKGDHFTSLPGHRVEALAPGPDGTWLAVVDRQAIWQHGADGQWSPFAKTDVELTALVTTGTTVFAGTSAARVLRHVESGAMEPVAAFDDVAGRDSWHAVGIPLQVRSMTATCDASALLVNVHVGGIPRSTDGGNTWQPTIDVDDDVHQVLAHPSRPEIVVAAASTGLCRSGDGGGSWTSTTTGMHDSYARGVAIIGDEVLVTVSDGPRGGTVGGLSSRRRSGWRPAGSGRTARVPQRQHRHLLHRERRHARRARRRQRRRMVVDRRSDRMGPDRCPDSEV